MVIIQLLCTGKTSPKIIKILKSSKIKILGCSKLIQRIWNIRWSSQNFLYSNQYYVIMKRTRRNFEWRIRKMTRNLEIGEKTNTNWQHAKQNNTERVKIIIMLEKLSLPMIKSSLLKPSSICRTPNFS